MLRLAVALLLVANLVYWAWAQGWLPAGWLPLPADGEQQREPQRLAAQQRPELIRLAGEPDADVPAAARCLQAGPYDAAAWAEAEAAVRQAGLAASQWQRVPEAEADAASGVPARAWLRVPAADAAQQAALSAASATLPGSGLRPCD